jgi:hypothetical protein
MKTVHSKVHAKGAPALLILLLGSVVLADRAAAVGCNTVVSQETFNLGTVTTNPTQECAQASTRIQCFNLTFASPGPFSQEHIFTFDIGCVTFIDEYTYTGSYGVPGFIRPKYQVVGIYYAPPGAKSTATS